MAKKAAEVEEANSKRAQVLNEQTTNLENKSAQVKLKLQHMTNIWVE